MNPIYEPSEDLPVPSKPRDPLLFLLLGGAAFSAAILWLKYRAGEPALDARTRRRLAQGTGAAG